MTILHDITVNSIIIHNSGMYTVFDTAGMWVIIRRTVKIGESYHPVGPDDMVLSSEQVFLLQAAQPVESLRSVQQTQL